MKQVCIAADAAELPRILVRQSQPHRSSRAARRCACIAALRLVVGVLPGSALAELSASPTQTIALDRFDHARKIAHLPNGIDLGYVDLGPRQGTPIVFLHGYVDSARAWVPLLPQLPRDRRLLIVDLRGSGISSKPDCCYSRFDLAYDVRLLLDALHVPEADIVGHSLGSIVAQTFAETWPERTHRLVLVSSTGGARAGCTASTAASTSVAMRAAIAQLSDPIDPESTFIRDWFASPAPVDPEFLRRQRRDAAATPTRVWLALIDQGIANVDGLQGMLPRIQAPTLLVWGGKDPIMGEGDRCALKEALPGAQVHVFTDLGHNPFEEDPAAFGAVLDPFLAAP